MRNYLNLDLDETLCSSMYASNEAHADQLLDMYGQHWKGEKFHLSNDGWYVTFLRPWSRELVEYFKMTMGTDNVGILSWGTNRYVLEVNKLLELGVAPYNVYAREDIQGPVDVPKLKNRNHVLVDNENYSYHFSGSYNKVNFLYGLKEEKLIIVPHFDVRYFHPDNEIDVGDLIKKIEETFEL